jgi:hypothetical protein
MDAFLAPAARLFVVDRNLAGRVVVSVNHEALPTRWERLHWWLLTNLENFRTAGPGKRQCPRWRHSGRNDDYLYAGASPDGSASEKKRRSLQRMIAGVSVVAVVALALAITSFVRYFAGSIG